MITSKELRQKYIEFFKSKGHIEIPSASLVPEHDPTVLFTTAGMHPLVPYLLGETHPFGKRLVNVQKCVRTVDIDDVGDSTHNTFFEMLGNWSLGDYFKNESICWSWEFLTDKKWLGIEPKRIKVTVFEGDKDAPRDGESIKIWQECFGQFGIEGEVYDKGKKNNETAKIFPLPKEDNWWGPAGMTGPCGPDTEMFIDLGKPVNFEKCPSGENCRPGCKCGRYVEIWNNVFMEYNKTAEGKFIPLKQKNVDTGMGMERTLAVLNGFGNVYETDVFKPVMDLVNRISPSGEIKAKRIIADHIRTAVFMISDGVKPSNIERGYVLRRIIRRAVRYADNLGLTQGKLITRSDISSIAERFINKYMDIYKNLAPQANIIFEEIEKEEAKFRLTLRKGMVEFEKMAPPVGISAEGTFYIYQSFGFPPEMTFELAKEKGWEFNREKIEEGVKNKIEEHQAISRTAAAGKFKGGLADQGEQAVKYHTATHLLLAALRKVLGEHIYQRGSNITTERLRFDFSHPEKITKEQIQKVEDIVNEQIQKNLPVTFAEMTLEDAKRLGAMGIFETKYGEKVKVYAIGDEKTVVFSREICGGPHVERIGVLGKFKIKKEESSSAGVRRIKAVLE